MANVESNRIIPSISAYARKHFFYVQEIGTLTSKSPHISTRNNLYSFLFLVVTNGSGTFTYHNEVHLIHTGDCVLINCQEPYSHESSEEDPWTLTWVHFYGIHLKDFYEKYLSMGYPNLFHPLHVTQFLCVLTDLFHAQTKKDSLTEVLSHKYLTDIITLSFTENKTEEEKNETISDKLVKIREYLLVHYKERLSLDLLASQFFISKFHLSREYKSYFGVTLMNDLTSIRISQAKSMLRFSQESVEEIALQCGFSDSAYFIRVFKQAESLTPSLYRKKW